MRGNGVVLKGEKNWSDMSGGKNYRCYVPKEMVKRGKNNAVLSGNREALSSSNVLRAFLDKYKEEETKGMTLI